MFKVLGSFFYMLSLNQEECEKYCREKRLERYRKYGGVVRRIPFHSLIHRILMPLLWCNQFFSGKKLTIVHDRRKTGAPSYFVRRI